MWLLPCACDKGDEAHFEVVRADPAAAFAGEAAADAGEKDEGTDEACGTAIRSHDPGSSIASTTNEPADGANAAPPPPAGRGRLRSGEGQPGGGGRVAGEWSRRVPRELNVPDSGMDEFCKEVIRIYGIPGARPDLPGLLAGMRATCQGPGTPKACQQEPSDDVLFARLLVSVDFDLKAAVRLLHERASFRGGDGGAVGPPAQWVRSGLVYVPFEDVRGRPVIFIRTRHHDTSKLSSEQFTQGFRASLDAASAFLSSRRSGGLSKTNLLEQCVLIVDLLGSGWLAWRGRAGLSQGDGRALCGQVRECKVHYPEFLGQAVILRPNGPFQAAWKLVKPLLPVRTRAKVEVVPEAQVESFMRNLVPAERLPKFYGGTAPDWPAPTAARDLADFCGHLAAAEWQRLGCAPKLA